MSCFSSAFQKFCNAVNISLLSFSYWCKSGIVQAAKQSYPSDLQLVPKRTYAEFTATWNLTAKPEQQKPSITLSNCIVCHIKRIEHSHCHSVVFLPFHYASNTEFAENRERVGKGDGQSPTASLSAMSCTGTLSTFPIASFMLLLILWKRQKISHL